MGKMRLGMKIYSYDWYWKYGLDYEQAARLLRSQGVDFVIAQNEFIPSMNTAAKAEVPPEQRERFAAYDDRQFRAALKAAGIEYWASALMFFHPDDVARFGNYPVDEQGERCAKEDWYIGACPSNDDYVAHRIGQIAAAAEALEPEGIFLGFMRFPGFWELWLPGMTMADWDNCCYCDDCMDKFARWRGQEGSGAEDGRRGQEGSGAEAGRRGREGSGVAVGERGRWIKDNCYEQWVDWKAFRLREIIVAIRAGIGARIKIMLNTVPFDEKHFGNARAAVFGQQIEVLSDVVDVFEVMTYHQILGRPASWVPEAIADVKRRVKSGPHGQSAVLCTVQGKPDYLTGMHAGKGRKENIGLDEVAEIITGVKADGQADGIVVYSWADFLEQRFERGSTEYIERINRCR